jgi:hypothetical protein
MPSFQLLSLSLIDGFKYEKQPSETVSTCSTEDDKSTI